MLKHKYAYFVVLVLVLIFFLLFRTSIVYGDSMEPTVKAGDFVIAYRWGDPSFRDIVLFKIGHQLRIKRVLGCPGDTIRFNQGALYRNNEIVQLQTNYSQREDFEITVPSDSYFLVGDNMFVSADSRNLGTVSRQQIVGLVMNRR